MIQPELWKRIHESVVAVWPELKQIVSLLVGIFVGWSLTSRSQKRQWVLDSKKQEYRELLSVLTRAHNTIVNAGGEFRLPINEQRAMESVRLESMNVIQDRIFIANEVKELEVLKKWSIALALFEKEKDWDRFGKAFETMSQEIVARAQEMMD